MRKLRASLPLIFFSALAVSGCQTTKREAVSLRPDVEHPQWFVCEAAGTRPVIPPEYKIDWAKVGEAPTVALAVEAAKAEVAKLIGTLRTREGVVAGYVLDLEGKNFVCFNNNRALLDFYRGLPQPGTTGARARDSGSIRVVGPVRLPGARTGALGFRS